MTPGGGEKARRAFPALKDEIHQNLPFRSKGHEAYLSLLRTADMARRRVGAVLHTSGVTLQQYNVLRILRGAGSRGLPTLEIADRMIERTPGITGLIDRLEERGWATRERSDGDRRTVRCRVTDAGLELLASLDAPIEELDADTFMRLEPEELVLLIGLLSKLRGHLIE